jgi:hypothetical protein
MALLELVSERPDWMGALGVALTRPPGVPERRGEDDPWKPDGADTGKRPRRISDDLAWLRQAMDEPERCGLRVVPGSAAGAAWERHGAARARRGRVRDRRVLDAAGFLLHD